MGNILSKVQNWWQTADHTQRVVTVFGSAFLVVMLGLTFFYASRPKMEPVFAGMSPEDKDMVYLAIKEYGFPVEYSATREVMVPSTVVNDVRARLRADNKAPKASATGLSSLLDGSSPFETPGIEKARTKAALEGDMARSVQQIEGVASAIVHINKGDESPFVRDKVEPTAVINVVEQPGYSLNDQQGKTIARIVQEGVGITAENVSVVSSSGRIIYDGDEHGENSSLMTRKLEAERAESARRERELQQRLDMAFGPGNTSVTVGVELDMDEVTITQNTTSPTRTPLSRSSVSESLSGNANPAGGATGADGNSASQPTAASDNDGSSYNSESTQEQFGEDQKTQTIRKAPGEVTSMTVAVLVNSAKINDIRPVQEFVNGLLKTKDKTSFSATVTPVEFNSESLAEHEKAQETAASAARTQQLISLLPIAALVGVGFMLMRTLTKSMKPVATMTAALPDGGSMALPMDTERAPKLRVEAAPEEEIEDSMPETEEPEIPTDDLPDLTEALAAMGIDTEPEPVVYQEEPAQPVFVGEIREKVDVPLEQIRKLSKEKPETVAMLLKSWLMED